MCFISIKLKNITFFKIFFLFVNLINNDAVGGAVTTLLVVDGEGSLSGSIIEQKNNKSKLSNDTLSKVTNSGLGSNIEIDIDMEVFEKICKRLGSSSDELYIIFRGNRYDADARLGVHEYNYIKESLDLENLEKRSSIVKNEYNKEFDRINEELKKKISIDMVTYIENQKKAGKAFVNVASVKTYEEVSFFTNEKSQWVEMIADDRPKRDIYYEPYMRNLCALYSKNGTVSTAVKLLESIKNKKHEIASEIDGAVAEKALVLNKIMDTKNAQQTEIQQKRDNEKKLAQVKIQVEKVNKKGRYAEELNELVTEITRNKSILEELESDLIKKTEAIKPIKDKEDNFERIVDELNAKIYANKPVKVMFVVSGRHKLYREELIARFSLTGEIFFLKNNLINRQGVFTDYLRKTGGTFSYIDSDGFDRVISEYEVDGNVVNNYESWLKTDDALKLIKKRDEILLERKGNKLKLDGLKSDLEDLRMKILDVRREIGKNESLREGVEKKLITLD